MGCGIGVLALHLQRTVGETGHVSGIDASPEMITQAQGKARKRGAPIDFRLAVAEALPFDAATFDRVTSTLVFHHLPDDVKQAGLREIQRVLIPGGRVVVANFAPGSGPLPHRVLARILGHLGQSHGHSHGHARLFLELMREAWFRDAERSVESLGPKVVVPMHYYTEGVTPPHPGPRSPDEWLMTQDRVRRLGRDTIMLGENDLPSRREVWVFEAALAAER